ncbi:MAG: putative selenate ABC transporter substrate-binding protein [bacterium]
MNRPLAPLVLVCSLLLSAALLAACTPAGAGDDSEPFVIGAIPDQDPERLQRLYGDLAAYLEAELGVPVEYRPVTDYAAAVTAFRVGDLDMVWFGGLTGVQARLQVEGAEALVQRDIDEQFTSVFIANRNSGLSPLDGVQALSSLEGHTFTFGSESSTSGRLMPQHFLSQAGLTLDDFAGEPGFSGSHDKTIELVEAGTYDAGALNSQVWDSRVAAGEVDQERVQVILRTPPYHDYHWVIRPDVRQRYGDDFPQRVTDAFLQLDAGNPDHQEILDLFGATQFIPTSNENYDQIEAVARQIGQIVEE